MADRSLLDLPTPCLLLDEARMQRNIATMRARLAALAVPLRAHVKTAKALPVVLAMTGGERAPIAVSTLAEAEAFFAAGFRDVLYAVGLPPGKVAAVASLRARGCDLCAVVDNLASARAIAAAGIPALIEIDSDGHRAGVRPAADELLAIAAALGDGGELRGVMTHAGASYDCRSPAAIAAMAEQERAAVVAASARLRAAGHRCPIVSVGSTPTATFATALPGVTEVRAGVFVFQDLVMNGLGVAAIDDIAISVLVEVIGHQRDKGWLLTDGGWMALSRDRGMATAAGDCGYGLCIDLASRPLSDLIVQQTNQEHGIIAGRTGRLDVARWPVGSRLRVLPNHACATASQHDGYLVLRGGAVADHWPRVRGW